MKRKIVRWTAILLGVPVVLLVAIAITGATFPRDHVAHGTARFESSPAEVFAVIADAGAAAEWRDDITSVELRGPTRFVEHGEEGDVLYEVVVSDAPRRRIVRIADPDLPYGGRWIYAMEPDGTGTRVTITEEGFVSNPLMRFFAHVAMDPSATIAGTLRALGRRLGEGDVEVTTRVE